MMLNLLADQTSFDNLFKALGTIGALGTFLWTVYTWREKSRQELAANAAESVRASRARTIEATKPFLERQLELYTVVTRVVAIIATADEPGEVAENVRLFMRLFSGELALVVNDEVAAAMKDFRQEMSNLQRMAAHPSAMDLAQNLLDPSDKKRERLQQLSFDLAQACRRSLAKSWHVDAWANPDAAA